jgi:single-stranded DNA-binding protein
MASLNQAIIMGNLVRDLEMKYSTSGIAICTFTVATNYYRPRLKESLFQNRSSMTAQPLKIRPSGSRSTW